MIGRLLAPAIDKMAAMDITNFVFSIRCAEYAVRSAIVKLKNELFGGSNGGAV